MTVRRSTAGMRVGTLGVRADIRRAERFVFLYDGDCSFCTTCANFIERRIPTNARVQAWQHADLAALGVTQAACEAMKGKVAKSFATASRENFGGPHLAWKAQEMGRPWAGFYVECGATGS